jgi:hypothetical protein
MLAVLPCKRISVKRRLCSTGKNSPRRLGASSTRNFVAPKLECRSRHRHGSKQTNQTTSGPVFIFLRVIGHAQTIPSVDVRSEGRGKLQLRVNAEQRTGRWRFRIEVADKTVPGADLDMTGGALGAIDKHRADRRGKWISHR